MALPAVHRATSMSFIPAAVHTSTSPGRVWYPSLFATRLKVGAIAINSAASNASQANDRLDVVPSPMTAILGDQDSACVFLMSQYADIEYGRSADCVPHSRFGVACITSRNSPPAVISSWRRNARSNGLPSSVALPM